MDKTEMSKSIISLLNSSEYKMDVLNKLYELSSEVVKNMKYKENSTKIRVLNLLLLNAYRSFNSFVTLLENNHFNDAFLLTRKISEILIRVEYLSITNSFDNYYREKSIEQAKILHSLINSHPIKYVSQSALWKIRHKIIGECKAIYNDQLNGKFEGTPNVEQMAEKSGLLVLYKKTYGALSKFVHSNMSVENFYLYEMNNNIFYDTGETDDNFNRETVKSVIDDTLYIYYLITNKYCLELGIFKTQLEEFNRDFFLFVSMDLVTGKAKSNVDISMNLVKNITGDNFDKEESDKEHEVMFVLDDETAFKDSWTKLEALVKRKESELKNT